MKRAHSENLEPHNKRAKTDSNWRLGLLSQPNCLCTGKCRGDRLSPHGTCSGKWPTQNTLYLCVRLALPAELVELILSYVCLANVALNPLTCRTKSVYTACRMHISALGSSFENQRPLLGLAIGFSRAAGLKSNLNTLFRVATPDTDKVLSFERRSTNDNDDGWLTYSGNYCRRCCRIKFWYYCQDADQEIYK